MDKIEILIEIMSVLGVFSAIVIVFLLVINTKRKKELEQLRGQLEEKVKKQTEIIRLQQEKKEELFTRTIYALSEAVEAKDRYTSGHSKRVALYSKMIAARLGKSEEEQEEIYRVGLLHDVGKIRVPEDVINKPRKLTNEEFQLMKIHPVTGYHILRAISDNSMLALGAKFHHERYDGKGYPNGLSGENIPEVARIIGVADSYDAMTSNRSYRKALPQEVVRTEIEKGKGTQFDPVIADIMIQMIDEDTEYTLRQEDDLKKTVLVVDDVPMNIELIQVIMEDEPMYEWLSANSGKEALEILKEHTVDLILLDVIMPEMDGFETLQRIRENYQVPVVFMTADKDIETIKKATKMGIDDYLTKPFLPLALKEVVYSISF